MVILYILKSQTSRAYKVGITDNMKSRLLAIEKEFEKINSAESLIYICENRKLIEKIEGGIHAFLTQHYYAPDTLGGGSTEWFEINSFDKCVNFVNLFAEEIEEFVYAGTLAEFLLVKKDWDLERTIIREGIYFMDIHTKTTELIRNFIIANIETLNLEIHKGYIQISNVDTSDLSIPDLPIFQWVTKDNSCILFHIPVYNQWKKSGIHKEIRGLVDIRFFDNFTLKNFKTVYRRK